MLGTAAVYLLVALLDCPWCDVFELICCAKSASQKMLSLLKPQAESWFEKILFLLSARQDQPISNNLQTITYCIPCTPCHV